MGGLVNGLFGGGGGGGSTTTVQKADPWSAQQPYLQQGFGTAQNLFYGPGTTNADGTTTNGAFMGGAYHPQYFDGSSAPSAYNAHGTVAGFTGNQTGGLQTMLNAMGQNSQPIGSALNTSGLLGTYGYANAHNPGNVVYDSVAMTALNNPANGALSSLANGGAMGNSSIGGLHSLAGQSLANPGMPLLNPTATGQAQAHNLGNDFLTGAAINGGIGNNALAQYASGAMLGSENPAWKQLSDSVTASTLPALEGQFTAGGAMNNPNAHYEIANGLASALAPYAEQNYNTQTQNQLTAANALSGNALGASSNLASNILGGQQLQANSADALGSLYNNGISNAVGALGTAGNLFNAGISNTLGATGQLSNNYQTALQQMLGAGQGLSNNYNTGNQQTIQNSLALPGLASANTNNAATQFNVGATQQAQNQSELTDLVNKWNYNQNLPLNMLNAYQQATGGSYGSTNTLTQPYFSNPLANAIGTGLGGMQMYGMGKNLGLWGAGAGAGAGAAGMGDLASMLGGAGSAGIAADGADALTAMAMLA